MVKLHPRHTIKKEETPPPSARAPRAFPWGWTIVGMVIVVILVAALATLPFWGELTGEKPGGPENTISFGGNAASEEGTEAEEPEILPSDVTLVVLNGTTTAGLAGKLKTTLEEEGYLVAKAGNADNFKYAQTLVRYPVGKDKEAKLVQESVVKAGYDALLEEAEVDEVTVIIGKV